MSASKSSSLPLPTAVSSKERIHQFIERISSPQTSDAGWWASVSSGLDVVQKFGAIDLTSEQQQQLLGAIAVLGAYGEEQNWDVFRGVYFKEMLGAKENIDSLLIASAPDLNLYMDGLLQHPHPWFIESYRFRNNMLRAFQLEDLRCQVAGQGLSPALLRFTPWLEELVAAGKAEKVADVLWSSTLAQNNFLLPSRYATQEWWERLLSLHPDAKEDIRSVVVKLAEEQIAGHTRVALSLDEEEYEDEAAKFAVRTMGAIDSSLQYQFQGMIPLGLVTEDSHQEELFLARHPAFTIDDLLAGETKEPHKWQPDLWFRAGKDWRMKAFMLMLDEDTDQTWLKTQPAGMGGLAPEWVFRMLASDAVKKEVFG